MLAAAPTPIDRNGCLSMRSVLLALPRTKAAINNPMPSMRYGIGRKTSKVTLRTAGVRNASKASPAQASPMAIDAA